MTTATDIEVDLAAWMDLAPQCEHYGHNVDSPYHEGDAAWVVHDTCPDCGDTQSDLRCDKWKRRLIELGGLIYCDCGRSDKAIDYHDRARWVAL